jgi:hypothetical protein
MFKSQLNLRRTDDSPISKSSSGDYYFGFPDYQKYKSSNSNIDSNERNEFLKQASQNYYIQKLQSLSTTALPLCSNENNRENIFNDDLCYYPKNFKMNSTGMGNDNNERSNKCGISPQQYYQYMQMNQIPNQSVNPQQFNQMGQYYQTQMQSRPNMMSNAIPQNFNDNSRQKGMNQMQNQVNNSKSYTMYGKTGWICSLCKNFNYESKILIFIFILI